MTVVLPYVSTCVGMSSGEIFLFSIVVGAAQYTAWSSDEGFKIHGSRIL